MRCSTLVSLPATSARKERHCFVASVLPAPLSPEMSTDWFLHSSLSFMYADWAMAKVWGGGSLFGDGLECSSMEFTV